MCMNCQNELRQKVKDLYPDLDTFDEEIAVKELASFPLSWITKEKIDEVVIGARFQNKED
jgi:hypothetical protein